MLATTWSIEKEIEFMAKSYILNKLKYLYTGYVDVFIKNGYCNVTINNKDGLKFEKIYEFDYLDSNSNIIVEDVKKEYKKFITENIMSKYFVDKKAL